MNLNGINTLETVSYGHGITTTPLQSWVYSALVNGGKIMPNLVKNKI